MPKKVHECVARLLADPKFNPTVGQGKSSKTKEEAAWAICNSRSEKDECLICEIEDMTLFTEALESIMKELNVKKSLTEESYLLEGITFTQFKETISTEDLSKINKFTVKPIESKDITVYTALLIDDKITRNNTLYNKDFQSMLLSLPAGEGNFIGSPILFGEAKDHQHAASAQVGRIFDAWQVIDKDKHYGVMAKIYVLNETNEDLISKINSGVLKEMSISTKVELPVCSICGQSILTCDHTIGINGCYVTMSGKGFVAEASFVAVPGSNSAKILTANDMKNFLRLENLEATLAPIIAAGVSSLPTIEYINEAIASGTVRKESMDALTTEISSMKESYMKINLSLEELTAKFKESETVVFPFDMLSALKGLKDNFESNKEFVIKTMSKYNLPITDFRTDTLPDLIQGLKGENTNLYVKILFDNIEALGINLSKIETFLKVVPMPTNASYAGDINDLVNVVRFLNKKIDSIQTRILKLQGKFDLELEQRNQLINETIKFGILSGKFNFTEKNLSSKFFENFTTEEIVTLKDKFFVESGKMFTPVIESIPVTEAEPKNVEKASLKEIATQILNGGK